MDAKQPTIPSSVVMLFPACLIGWAGAKVTGGEVSFSRPSGGMIVGAALGLLIGFAVWLDDKLVKQRLAKLHQDDGPAQPQPDSTDTPSEALAGLMLLISAVVGVLLWQGHSFGLSPEVSYGLGSLTIVLTSIMGYVDARQLTIRVSGRGVDTGQFNPVMIFLGIMGLWLLCFPAYFLQRRKLGARNLLIPAIIVTCVFFASNMGYVLRDQAFDQKGDKVQEPRK